jgi:hypothetical protein
MSKKVKKFVVKEGRGSLWFVEKKDRRHKDIRLNGQMMINGELHWVTLFKNHGGANSPKYNSSLGDVVKSKK